MSFKTIPAFLEILGSPEKLPPVPKLLYENFNQKPYLLYLGFALTVLFIYHMVTSRWWKVKLFKVFRMFEKAKFITLLRILHPLSDLSELLSLIAGSGLSKAWVETINEVIKFLRKGVNPQKAFRLFLTRNLIEHSESLFISTAVEKSDFSILKNAEDLFQVQLKSSLEFTKRMIEIFSLIMGAVIIGGLYISVLLQLMMKLRSLQ